MDRPPTEQMGNRPATPAGQWCSPIVELRQYLLHPGQREVLIALFERAFIESQEALGMQVIGTFRDLDDPNRFVWIRGFADMERRRAALQAFYHDGPVWQAHRAAANATMVDSDNVLLLRPARPTSCFLLDPQTRPPLGTTQERPGLVVATILSFEAAPAEEVLAWVEDSLPPALAQQGASLLAWFVTEDSPNTFPALPVREGEQVLVAFARLQDPAADEHHGGALAPSQQEHARLWAPVRPQLKAEPQVLRLVPTARSLLRG
ncbi:MAG TPA: NIPSNAP family protein [Ktedonobacterales bacterium]|nr:NIPSNAP family protein [Ktedonobacterales bacterium]